MQIRAALAANPRNLLLGVVGAATIAFGVAWSNDTGSPARTVTAGAWAVAVTAWLLRIRQLSVRFNRQARSDTETHEWGRRITRHAMIAAAAWGVTSWLFFPASIQQEAWVSITIAMVVMGGAGAQASYRPLVTGFVLVLTAVFCAGLLRTGDRYLALLALANLVFSSAVLMFARDQEETVRAAIELGFEKEALLQDLTVQHQATKRAYQKAEDALRVAEEAQLAAEKADRAKTQFLASATHDLRGPMNTIGLLVGLMQEWSGPRDPWHVRPDPRTGRTDGATVHGVVRSVQIRCGRTAQPERDRAE